MHLSCLITDSWRLVESVDAKHSAHVQQFHSHSYVDRSTLEVRSVLKSSFVPVTMGDGKCSIDEPHQLSNLHAISDPTELGSSFVS